MRWLIFLFLIAEYFLASACLAEFGFWVTLLIYWLPTVFGLPLLISHNQMNWVQFQMQMKSGKIPDESLLKLLAGFVGSILMLIPSLVVRIFSMILIFPPTRFLTLVLFRGWIIKKISEGSFKVFSSGQGFPFDPNAEREARVIDVEAIDISATKVESLKKDSSDQN